MEGHYLLARLHVLLALYQDYSCEDHLQQAWNAYREALNFDGDRCSTVCMSVALFCFYIRQPRDCFDYMGRSIHLDSYEPLAWRNLGILVSSTLSSGQRSLQLTLA